MVTVGETKPALRVEGLRHRYDSATVLELDGFNPQVASRLMGAFNTWRMLEPGRRGHAERALNRVAGADGLSPDVFEIVTKTLE